MNKHEKPSVIIGFIRFTICFAVCGWLDKNSVIICADIWMGTLMEKKNK